MSTAYKFAKSIEAAPPVAPPRGGGQLRPEEILKAPGEAFKRIEEVLPPGVPRLSELAPKSEVETKEAEKPPKREMPTVEGVRLKLA